MAQLKVRQAKHDHKAATNTYIGVKVSVHLADTKMASLKIEGTDMELMAAAQVIGIDTYIYH